MRKREWLLRAGALAVQCGVNMGVIGNSPAHADTNESGSAEQASPALEISFTVRRRSENLQEVPISITAISGDELNQMGIGSTLDLSMTVPGLTLPESGGTSCRTFAASARP
jgi:iron complex outermembrane receptor protein